MKWVSCDCGLPVLDNNSWLADSMWSVQAITHASNYPLRALLLTAGNCRYTNSLFFAAAKSSGDIIRLLIAAGLPLNGTNIDGCTPVDCAQHFENCDALHALQGEPAMQQQTAEVVVCDCTYDHCVSAHAWLLCLH